MIKTEKVFGAVRHYYPFLGVLAASLLLAMIWKLEEVLGVIRDNPLPCVLYLVTACLLSTMYVEYTLLMVPPNSPPYDLGFSITRPLHRLLSSRPALHSFLAGVNTVFLVSQIAYILWTVHMEDRPRATLAMLLMLLVRGILGYCTRLPLPQEYLCSGCDYPIKNAPFFLFYSGHVGVSVVASLDLRRTQRLGLARTCDVLNAFQVVRLLSTRGHYTIDMVAGVGAGILFDFLAAKFLDEWNMMIVGA